MRRRLGPANTGELVGGTGSHLLFNERRTPGSAEHQNPLFGSVVVLLRQRGKSYRDIQYLPLEFFKVLEID